MSLEAIAALLGHKTMTMAMVYARIADRTVADEYFAVTKKVEALYQHQEDFRKLFAYAFNAIHTPGRPPVWLRCVTLRGIPPATAGSPF